MRGRRLKKYTTAFRRNEEQRPNIRLDNDRIRESSGVKRSRKRDFKHDHESQFYPYGGENVVTEGLTNQKHKFEGKERDPESASTAQPQGLDYFGARFDSSATGRFMSPDWANKPEPVPYAKLGNPQTLNLYAFAGNNPESDPDLDGHEMETAPLPSSCDGNGGLCSSIRDSVSEGGSIQGGVAAYDNSLPQAKSTSSPQTQSGPSGPQAQQQSTSSTATTNPNAKAEQHQYDLVVNRTNKLLGTDDAADHIDSDGKLDGGKYAFSINHNDKSDDAFQRSLNKALGEATGDTGAHGGLTPPTHRLGFSTSLHHDNDALHVDHFNGAKFPIGTLLHAIVDVGIGHLAGPNFAFSYAGVQQ